MNTTNISEPQVYSMGLGSSSSLHGAIPPTLVKIKCQHHSSVVNSTGINRDINIHRPKRYPWSPCLHYSETFAWKGTNWVKCSGSLSIHYKSSSWKMSIYLSTNCVYHSIRKHMDETKGLVLHMTLLEPSFYLSQLCGLTSLISPWFMLQRIVLVAE